MNTKIIYIVVTMLFPFPVRGQVEMTIEPLEKMLHVAEPVDYIIKVKNQSKHSVTGLFNLAGLDPSFRIYCGKVGAESVLFHNEAMWSAEHDDGSVKITTIVPGQELIGGHCIHYDARFQKQVFAIPGDYEVGFDLAWDRRADGGPVVSSKLSVKAKVTVVPWDPKKDKRQIDALAIWDNAEVATFVQNMEKKTPEADARLKRLKDEYGDTLYGGLAIAALEKEKEQEKQKALRREMVAQWEKNEKMKFEKEFMEQVDMAKKAEIERLRQNENADKR